jgi:hypothetical protein
MSKFISGYRNVSIQIPKKIANIKAYINILDIARDDVNEATKKITEG